MFTGIDIGGTKCAVVVGDSHKITDKIRFDTTDVTETIERIFSSIEKLGVGDAIGISCGGPLDTENGVILSPPNLPGWDNIEIVRMLEESFGVPCGIQNDANACALAEWKFGAGKGTHNMIFLTFGTGMGAGLILNDSLYCGTNGMAGEIGHIRIEKTGPVGFGKAGSFEGFCSGNGIAQMAKAVAESRLKSGMTSAFCENQSQLDTITAKKVAECVLSGDPIAAEIFDKCAEKLGVGISVLIDILNPEMIVIGSIYERCENLLCKLMKEIVKSEALELSQSVCKIVPAVLGNEIGDFAALAVAHETYIQKRRVH